MRDRSKLIAEDSHAVQVQSLQVLWNESSSLSRMSRRDELFQILFMGWNSIRRSPLTSVLTLISTSAALFLFALFMLVVANSQNAVSSMSEKLTASIYIKEGIDDEAVTQLLQAVKAEDGVVSVAHRSKKDALKAFSEMVGTDSPILLGLDAQNPLPQSIEISFSDEAVRQEKFKRVINDFTNSQFIESIRINEGSFSEIGIILKALRLAGWIGTVLMLGIAGLIISNAVRLGIYAHRQEIEIMSLVGATKWYMRAPFLVEGALEGLIGAVFGVILLYIVYIPIRALLEGSTIGNFWYGSLHFLGLWSMLFVVICGMLTGLLSSYLATQSVEPK